MALNLFSALGVFFMFVFCSLADTEEHEFKPSVSMDVENGWRVIQNPWNTGSEVEPTKSTVDTVISNMPEIPIIMGSASPPTAPAFRIQVLDDSSADENPVPVVKDNLPAASAFGNSADSEEIFNSDINSPLRIIRPPYRLHESMTDLSPPMNYQKEKSLFYPTPIPVQVKYPESFDERLPFFDIPVENNFLRSPQTSVSHTEPDFVNYPSSYFSIPKPYPVREIRPIKDNSIEYYEIDENAVPIILDEELVYGGLPPKFKFPHPKLLMPPRSPRQNVQPSSLVKVKRVIRKINPRQRHPYLRFAKSIPIVRGRFRVK
ncbi:uncharacterized protein LOC129744172 isoform X1 [Uranotaenia lowii]|uniref:uncharacterized protein LOC129744172 isoform X1 n=1 Tax=Uranotaenia lowii TaxID=190385 RepID=UPI0024796A14|nr:uncharacterized protein LOC129744172 isoform X1 [Uranotaenia lowii]